MQLTRQPPGLQGHSLKCRQSRAARVAVCRSRCRTSAARADATTRRDILLAGMKRFMCQRILCHPECKPVSRRVAVQWYSQSQHTSPDRAGSVLGPGLWLPQTPALAEVDMNTNTTSITVNGLSTFQRSAQKSQIAVRWPM